MPTHLHPGHAGACTWDTVFLPHGCGRRGTPVTNCTSACGLFAQRRWWLGLGDKAGAARTAHIQPTKHQGSVAFLPPHHINELERVAGVQGQSPRGPELRLPGRHTRRIIGPMHDMWQCAHVLAHVPVRWGAQQGPCPHPASSVQLGQPEHSSPCSRWWVAAGLTRTWVMPLSPCPALPHPTIHPAIPVFPSS